MLEIVKLLLLSLSHAKVTFIELGTLCTCQKCCKKNSTFQIVILCNSGHVTGTSTEDIIDLFSTYGPIENVTLVRGKSFSFVTFCDISSAKAAMDANGQKCLHKVPVYLTYVNSIPERLQEKEECKILPEGLIVHPDFVSHAEELELLNHLKWDQHSEALKNRQVRHFGKIFVYGSNTIDNGTGNNNISKKFLNITPDLLHRCGRIPRIMDSDNREDQIEAVFEK